MLTTQDKRWRLLVSGMLPWEDVVAKQALQPGAANSSSSSTVPAADSKVAPDAKSSGDGSKQRTKGQNKGKAPAVHLRAKPFSLRDDGKYL